MTTRLEPGISFVTERLRDARAAGTPLRIAGGGTWLDAGRPCEGLERLDLRALNGVIAYEPGDLTLTARAATSLAEIAHVTETEGQWLTLDPCGSPSGTLGATMATASAGPLASAFGTPRDHVLGCEFVTGRGDVVRAGGRVVKNVAGFDLTRLVTGAWGTLGAITEVTVRLRARPKVDRTLAIRVAASSPHDIADAAWRRLRAGEYTPMAAELISPRLARHLGAEGAHLLLRLGGNVTYVRAAENDLAALGAATEADGILWSALASAEQPGAMVVRFSVRPSRIGGLWSRASDLAESVGGFAHATVARGIVRCVLPALAAGAPMNDLGTRLSEVIAQATVIGERLPLSLWQLLATRRPNGALADSVRRAFDPDGIMNPGILGAS